MNKSKLNTYLLYLGFFGLIWGAGSAYIGMKFDIVSLCAMIGGGLFILYAVASTKKIFLSLKSSNDWRRLIGIVFIVLLLIFALIQVNYLANLMNIRYDLTKYKQHTLSKETIRLVGTLRQDVKLTAFHVDIPPRYLEDLLGEYARNSRRRIKTEIVDPIERIGYAAQFGSVISGKEMKVIVQSGNQRRDVNFTEETLDEELLNNAILRVTRPARTACFTAGHGEYNIEEKKETGYSTLAKHLLANNIMPQRLMLGVKSQVPDQCNVVVVAGPKSHLSSEEENFLNEYLKKGGDALFLIEHTVVTTPEVPLSEEDLKKNPSLNSLLNQWGLDVASDIVVDLASHASGDVGSPATNNYIPHPGITKGMDYSFFVRPRSISIVPRRRESLGLVPLVLTASNDQSWGETDRTLKVKFNEGVDRIGPVPIAYVVFEPKAKGEASDTRMIVITDADFLSNNYIDYYDNGKLGVSVINWLTESDYQSFVTKKDVKVEKLDLTSRQKRLVTVFLFMIPVLVLGTGFSVWMKKQ